MANASPYKRHGDDAMQRRRANYMALATPINNAGPEDLDYRWPSRSFPSAAAMVLIGFGVYKPFALVQNSTEYRNS